MVRVTTPVSKQKARLVGRRKPVTTVAPPNDGHCVTRPVSPTTGSMSLPAKPRRCSTSDLPDEVQDNNPEDCPELTVPPSDAYNRLLKQLEAKDAEIAALTDDVARLTTETQMLQAKWQCEAKLRMQIVLDHSKLQMRMQTAAAKALEVDALRAELAAQEMRFTEKLEHEKRVSRIELKAAHNKINSLHQAILEMEYESVRKEQTKLDPPTQSVQSRHIQQELMGLQRQRCVSQSKWLFEGDNDDAPKPPKTPRHREEPKPRQRDEVSYLFDIAEQLLIFSKDSHLNALTTLEGFEEALEKTKCDAPLPKGAGDALDLAACEAIADEAEALLAQYLFRLP
ncbi:hypothetical protein ACHHYP_03595 [Achlya hypogyna]|uniref:Uncharacterized protein n=1 Tax=Achlya hypogyna TaxID=1202772 RepID=A0A1V9Z3N3_ACHHY|nr:hypothetical protein ACHHYP_03595 [Achlya hypogyna]